MKVLSPRIPVANEGFYRDPPTRNHLVWISKNDGPWKMYVPFDLVSVSVSICYISGVLFAFGGIYLCEMLLVGFLTEELWMIIDDLTRFYMDGGQKRFGTCSFQFCKIWKTFPLQRTILHVPESMKFPLEFQQKICIHRIFVAGVVFFEQCCTMRHRCGECLW